MFLKNYIETENQNWNFRVTKIQSLIISTVEECVWYKNLNGFSELEKLGKDSEQKVTPIHFTK